MGLGKVVAGNLGVSWIRLLDAGQLRFGQCLVPALVGQSSVLVHENECFSKSVSENDIEFDEYGTSSKKSNIVIDWAVYW